jgi:hypothetical protein
MMPNHSLPSSQPQLPVVCPSAGLTASLTLPYPALPNGLPSGICNEYLPNNTTLARFLWTINFFTSNGIYAVIDNHFREDQTILSAGITAWAQVRRVITWRAAEQACSHAVQSCRRTDEETGLHTCWHPHMGAKHAV